MKKHLPTATFKKWKELGAYRYNDAKLEKTLGGLEYRPMYTGKNDKGDVIMYYKG